MTMNEKSKRPPGTFFIAFSGKKQTGKDTSVEMSKSMLEASGKTVGVTAFAETVKETAINVLGLDRHLVYGSNDDKETPTHVLWDNFPMDVRLKYSNENFVRSWGGTRPKPRTGPMTIREVLQVMGTDIFREMFEQDVWANSPFRRDWSQYDVVFITDCRFPNEKRVIEERDGIVIRLVRNTGFNDTHPSETALDDFTFEYQFENNGSLDELRDFIRNILLELELI